MRFVDLTKKVEQIACKNSLFFRLTMIYYKSMVRREVRWAGITSSDHVLYIGGGPCPHTALLINALTGAKVTIVDNDEKSVRSSLRLLKQKGVDDQISVLLQDGADLDPSGYSVIHMAVQITPIEKVFNAVWQKADDDCVLLMRLPKNNVRKLYVHRELPSPVFIDESPRPLRKIKHGLIGNVGFTSIYIK